MGASLSKSLSPNAVAEATQLVSTSEVVDADAVANVAAVSEETSGGVMQTLSGNRVGKILGVLGATAFFGNMALGVLGCSNQGPGQPPAAVARSAEIKKPELLPSRIQQTLTQTGTRSLKYIGTVVNKPVEANSYTGSLSNIQIHYKDGSVEQKSDKEVTITVDADGDVQFHLISPSDGVNFVSVKDDKVVVNVAKVTASLKGKGFEQELSVKAGR